VKESAATELASVLEEDDYRLFEASRNKEVSALSAEYAAMLRRQRVTIGMAEIYVKRVPPARRDGVVAALRVQSEDLMQMRRRFAQCIQAAERAQSRGFCAGLGCGWGGAAIYPAGSAPPPPPPPAPAPARATGGTVARTDSP
jgi:hypothetical protein